MDLVNPGVPRNLELTSLTIRPSIEDLFYYYPEYYYGDGEDPKIVLDANGIASDLPIKALNRFQPIQIKAVNGDLVNLIIDEELPGEGYALDFEWVA